MPSHLGRLFGDPETPAAADEALRSAVALRVTAGDWEIYAIPKVPQDLMAHQCINQGVQSEGGLYVWDFERRGRQVNVRVDGPLIFNTTQPQIDAALAGLGIVLLPEDKLMPYMQSGQLLRVLEDWCPKFEGCHLYCPSRRQPSPAFTLVVKTLRFANPSPSKR